MSSYTTVAAITPSNTVPLSVAAQAIYVGGAGDVVVQLLKTGANTTFKSVPVGTILPVRATLVLTSTTATNLLALN